MQRDLHLTDEEEQMLRGEFGKAKQKALTFIIEFAKAVNAERLCQVSRAQLFVGAHHYLDLLGTDDIDQVISEMYLNSPERVVIDRLGCKTQTDATPLDPDQWEKLGISREHYEKDCQYRKRFVDAGASSCGTCASYLTGFIPVMGEHYVSTESHALLLMNSLWGACANADSIEASIAAAVCGRTPYSGMHVADNRFGTHVFHIDTALDTVLEWDLMGLAVGSMLPTGAVPVLMGDFERPDLERLKSCFAAMATTGGPELCHIVGVTPEARTLDDALGGKSREAEYRITEEDLDRAHRLVSATGPADINFVSLGCPHYSLPQIREVADWLRNRRIHSNVRFQVWTAPSVKDSATRSGYTEIIESAGGLLLTSTCPLVSDTVPKDGAIVFDSCKQAKYVAACTKAKIFVGTPEACLEAAVTGRWQDN